MGFGKKKRLIREAIDQWKCDGYFGYGQGRAANQFEMDGRSACLDICTRASTCRARHHELMNQRFPQLARLIETSARIATARQLNVNDALISTMNQAVAMNLDEALEVKQILGLFKLDTMTDHYRCGQFENIRDGLDKVPPGTNNALKSIARLPDGKDLLSSSARE